MSRVLACVAALGMLAVTPADAAEPGHLTFETHAAFFSAETKQPKLIDPQMFVHDATAPAATGPQGIKHEAGGRPALPATDPGTAPVFNADGKPLGFTLGEWLAATGEATLTPAASGVSIAMSFRHLRPNAQYSLFENHFDQSPVGFTPLDGAGTANGFRSDAEGNATVTVKAPQPLTHANAILVIYDEDGLTHGASRGDIGRGAQHQLIARPPG